MKLAYAALAACTLALSSPALAHEDDHHDEAGHEHEHQHAHEHEGVVHYAVETPASDDAALKLIQEKADKVAEILKAEKLDGNHLESIHEQTYSIEAAVNKLREGDHNDAQEAALDVVDEANQALHYSSENHEEAAVREWFAKLHPSVDTLEAAYQ